MTFFKRFLFFSLIALFCASTMFFIWLLPPQQAACMIFSGGTILTMDDEMPEVEALLVRDGRIAARGALAEVEAHAKDCKEYDLAGKTLMPGLIEPHTHPIASALLSQTIDVSGFTHNNRASIMAALKAQADKGGGGPLLAFGWDPVIVEDLDPPTLAELDALAPNRPLMILTQMMHDAYANSAALAAAGITNETPNPEGGEFVRDESGKLTGTVREVSAIGVLMQATPKAPEGAMALLLNLQYGAYAKAGYTTIGALGPSGNVDDPLALMRDIATAGANSLRTIVYALPPQIDAGEWQVDSGTADKTFMLRGVKFWMDGSPFAGGAAFAEPYEDTKLTRERLHLTPPHIGQMNYSAAAFENEFTRFHKAGFHIAVHVQGEQSIDRVLDVAEKALAVTPRPDHRHRLEHNALITNAQIIRAKALGFTLSFFVDHIYFYGHRLPELVGADRTQRYMPLGAAVEAGHRVTFHTDNPATPINPFRALHTALTRQPRSGGAPINMVNALSRIDGLKAMTVHAAWQLGLEKDVGTLNVGKYADLVLLSANPASVPTDKLNNIVVHETWLAGRRTDTRQASLKNGKLLLDIVQNIIF